MQPDDDRKIGNGLAAVIMLLMFGLLCTTAIIIVYLITAGHGGC